MTSDYTKKYVANGISHLMEAEEKGEINWLALEMMIQDQCDKNGIPPNGRGEIIKMAQDLLNQRKADKTK
jgi:hypothetical protein